MIKLKDSRLLLKILILVSIYSGVLLVGCKDKRGIATGVTPLDTSAETLIRKQKEIMKNESQDIDLYIARRGYKMNTTKTGLRYLINTSNLPGDSIRALEQVSIKYKVSLLNGETIYTSDSTGTMNITIGRSDVANGLQEGLQLMRTGERALFIIPSHLGYGLTGDGDKIKGYQTLVVEVDSLVKNINN
ncbi:MAG: FKBP-type peptidyl-prolyl cis-trans isomerase [Bacteroidota bacterium]